VATAPSTQDLVQAGVWWLNRDWTNYEDVWDDDDYSDNVYFTRLHVRYNRKSFPQDLVFQVTPNKDNYQARYVITHPATGDFNCEAGKKYLKELKQRRANELEMLTYLTGKDYSNWDMVSEQPEEKYVPKEASYASIAPSIQNKPKKDKGILVATLSVVGLISLAGLRRKKNNS
jgi:hypothetical protein